jgi:hypothetical protein
MTQLDLTAYFFVGLHGDKTYNTFLLWKHHVNLLLQSSRSVIIITDDFQAYADQNIYIYIKALKK